MKENISYANRICALDTLELRRYRNDLVTTFKIVNKLFDINPSTLSHSSHQPLVILENSQIPMFMPHLPKSKLTENFSLTAWFPNGKICPKISANYISPILLILKNLHVIWINSQSVILYLSTARLYLKIRANCCFNLEWS
jgi:hypothetical protein